MNHSISSNHNGASDRAIEHSSVSWQTPERRGADRRSGERRSIARRGGEVEDLSAGMRHEIEEHQKLAAELRETVRELKVVLRDFRSDRELQSEVERQTAESMRQVVKESREAVLRAADENREVKAEMRDSLRAMMDLLQRLTK
jgi:hypothetical protein